MPTKYDKTIEYLTGFISLPNAYPHDGKNPKKYSDYLKRTQFFFDLIKNPEKKIPIIHVSGTAGKGSTSGYIQSILTQSGKKTGLFTTPYASVFTEEFKIDDKYISQKELVEIVDYLKPLIDKAYANSPYGGPSHYEIKTAIALIYFTRQKCDYAVLEVGLGGEFDATNIVKNKVAAAITNIGYDHTDILGNSLTQITKAKAGIIKPACPVFTTEAKPTCLNIIKATAKKNRSTLEIIKSKNPNQDLASAVCTHLGVSQKNIKQGVKKMFMPARFESMPNSRVIIDGAHNENKIKYTLNRLKEIPYNKLWVIYGSSQNKPSDKILKLINPVADKLILTKFNNYFRTSANPHILAKTAKANAVFMDNNQALDYALKNARPKDLILVTGSFFLAGELRTRWYSKEHILKTRRSN